MLLSLVVVFVAIGAMLLFYALGSAVAGWLFDALSGPEEDN